MAAVKVMNPGLLAAPPMATLKFSLIDQMEELIGWVTVTPEVVQTAKVVDAVPELSPNSKLAVPASVLQ